ncbi:Hypothetical predicted protein, partial [Pelobates cultripes]
MENRQGPTHPEGLPNSKCNTQRCHHQLSLLPDDEGSPVVQQEYPYIISNLTAKEGMETYNRCPLTHQICLGTRILKYLSSMRAKPKPYNMVMIHANSYTNWGAHWRKRYSSP